MESSIQLDCPFYDFDGNVADKQMLFSLYGDAVMPPDPTA